MDYYAFIDPGRDGRLSRLTHSGQFTLRVVICQPPIGCRNLEMNCSKAIPPTEQHYQYHRRTVLNSRTLNQQRNLDNLQQYPVRCANQLLERGTPQGAGPPQHIRGTGT